MDPTRKSTVETKESLVTTTRVPDSQGSPGLGGSRKVGNRHTRLPAPRRLALIGSKGRQSRAGSHWAQARKSCGCVVAVGSATAIFKSVASGAQRARHLRLLSPCFGLLARAGAARAVLSAQRALRRPDIDGPAPCSAAPSSRRACGGGTDLVPRPRIAASRPLGSRCRTRLSRVSRGGRRAAIDPDLEPLLRTDFRELGREAAPSVADLQWRVQSGPYFRGEGDGDSPAGWKRHLLPVPGTCPSSCAITCCREGSFLPDRACRSPVPPAHTVPAGQGLLPLMSPLLAKALHRRPEPSNSGCRPPAPGPHLARVPAPFLRRPGLAGAAHRKATGLHRRFSPPKRSYPSWSPPLSCPACRRLPLTPALDACRYHRPPIPSFADADVAAFASPHGPPLRDPSDSYHRQQGPPCQGPGSLVPMQASPPCSNLSS
ncbi:uncharacterized protein [Manis javanica]|uniref:uncharacterized protein n=1 Tax=Manis javanica TaxID=9974 RepID=UPI003C6D1588